MDRSSKKTLSQSRKKWDLLQSQLALIHGVLEELCERQEAISAWHMEFGKRLVGLHEKQWQTMEAMVGHELHHPSDPQLNSKKSDKVTNSNIAAAMTALEEIMNEGDGFTDANEMVPEVEGRLKKKKIRRLKKQARILQQIGDANDLVASTNAMDNSESVLVLNDSQTVN